MSFKVVAFNEASGRSRHTSKLGTVISVSLITKTICTMMPILKERKNLFHDEPSLAEAVNSLEFIAANDSNSISGTASISPDGNLRIGRDDDIGRRDDIQMVDR